MDRFKSAVDIVRKIHELQMNSICVSELISDICNYFDRIKNEKLSDADLKFLRHIAIEVGIPHYFDMLNNFQSIRNRRFNIDLNTLQDLIKESVLHTSEDCIIHKYQKEVLLKFKENKLNRFFLSASTSFGKTFLVYEIIRKMKYNNIVLIFPTIALLSENLKKIYTEEAYTWIKESYKIHTLSDVEILSEHNIFIYTPERFLSFMDKTHNIAFDFLFVDEAYKIDNEYIIDNESHENERDIAYRLAIFFGLVQHTTDALLAGPYIDFYDSTKNNYNPSFDYFLRDNNIELLNYNHIEIVNKKSVDIKSRKNYEIDDNYAIHFNEPSKPERFKTIVSEIKKRTENSIVYCHSRTEAEAYAKRIVQDDNFNEINYSAFADFIAHIETVFGKSIASDWIVVKALKKGIGIHHGLIPKYIQKEIIQLFNNGYINILLSTTTLTEGVNTTSKNIIILSDKKGAKPLKKFDAKNIEGRAGRFLQHYSGQVFILQNQFSDIINGEDECIKHKNYDSESPKQEIDLYYTGEQYLNHENVVKREEIDTIQTKYGIPEEVISSFKVISKQDKLLLYSRILTFTRQDVADIEKLIKDFNATMYVNSAGFQKIIDTVLPIVKDNKLKELMTYVKEGRTNPAIIGLVISYISGGLNGSIIYNMDKKGKTFDEAMRISTDFIYNTLKYQVVKYFGAFNLMYKYWKSTKTKKPMEEVTGIDAMLLKFEYNTSSKLGRLVSDFGVPQKIVEYYDVLEGNRRKAASIQNSFDSYERTEFSKIQDIVDRNMD